MGDGEPAIEAYDLGPAGLSVAGYGNFLRTWLLFGGGATGVAGGVGWGGAGVIGWSLSGEVGRWVPGVGLSWLGGVVGTALGIAGAGVGVCGLAAAAGSCVCLGGAASRRALRVFSGVGVGLGFLRRWRLFLVVRRLLPSIRMEY